MYEENKKSELNDSERQLLKTIKYMSAFIIGISLLFMTFGTVGAGERGVKTRLGAIVGTVEPGLYFKLPLVEKVTKLEVKTRTVNYDKNGSEGDEAGFSSLSGASKDLQDVSIGVMVNYHIDPSKVEEIYSQYRSVDNFEVNVIEPIIREVVKSTSAQYTAEELVTKRAEYGDKVNLTLADRFITKNALLERFSVTNFEFSKAFTQAIEAKVTAVQNAEAAKNKLEQVKFEAQQTIETAKATAESIRIQAQAITQQGGAEYVRLKLAEKWDGKLPATMLPDSSIPFLGKL